MLEPSPQPNMLAAGRDSGLSPRFWLLVPITGVGAGLAAGALMKLLRLAQHLSWSYAEGEFLEAVRHADWQRRIEVLAVAGLAAGVVRYLLKQPPGGHAGELAEAIWFRSGDLPLLRTAARAMLSVVIVGMGASLGREAAPKQSGAAIASALARRVGLSPAERRLLVACGAGAGMGAVYNVPFGGALFALEVLLGTVALPLIAPALATSLIATWVSWLMLPDRPTYSLPAYGTSSAQVVWAALAGPLLGLAAVLYVRLIAWADSRKPSGWPLLVSPLIVFALLGLVACEVPDVLGNGRGVVQHAFLGAIGLAALLRLLLLKPLATAGCLGSGAPGGLFTPTLSCGALMGGALGIAWRHLWPGAPLGSYAVIGAGAFLAAAMQGPIASVVLLLELTHGREALLVPLLLAVAGAGLVARRLEARSIYSARIHSGRAAALVATGPAGAFEGAMSHDFAVLSAAAPFPEVLEKLLETKDDARRLYVLDQKGKLQGIVPATLPSHRPAPLAIATAGDLAQPVAALSAAASRSEAEERLKLSGAAELPVVEPGSGRLLGVLRRR